MTWTLIVLILGTVPPRGVEVTGFKTQQECIDEMQLFCDRSTIKHFRCKCIPPQEQQS